MRTIFASTFLLAAIALAGCGGDTLDPSEIADPSESYARSIRSEVEGLLQTAPDELASQAEIAMESLEDTSNAGSYADTIGQIKEKVAAIAGGDASAASDLKELLGQLPGGDEGGGDEGGDAEPVQE